MKTIFEKSSGVDGINLTDKTTDVNFIPQNLLREGSIGLPQLSELETMRHYKELSDLNFCIGCLLYYATSWINCNLISPFHILILGLPMNLLGNKERCFIMLPLFQTITDIPLALFKNFTCCCSEPMYWTESHLSLSPNIGFCETPLHMVRGFSKS